jgi:hypothetical protein
LYRFAWSALLTGAVLALILSIWSASPTAVIALRLAKSAVLIGVASLLLYRRRRDPVAALLALAFLTWTITSSFDLDTRGELTRLLDRLRFLLFAVALLLFPDGRWNPRWGRAVALVSGSVFLFGIGEALSFFPTHLFLALAIPCVLAAVVSLICRYRGSLDYLLKQQLKWIALGLIAGVGFILCARGGAALQSARVVAIPLIWDAMFQVGVMIVALGFLVSLLRFRLFDAETVISRSAAYATLTMAVVATFGGTEALIQNIGQNYLGMNVGGVSGGMAAAVAALLLNPLHEQITTWAEDRFQPDLAQLKRELPELLAGYASSSSAGLCRQILPRINMAVHATRSAFIIEGRVIGTCGISLRQARRWASRSFGEGTALRFRDGEDSLFPLRLPFSVAGRGSGWLVIGRRPDGTLLGTEDTAAIRAILPAVKNALIASRASEAVELALERREKQIRREIDQIITRLQALEGSDRETARRVRDQRSQASEANAPQSF